MTPSKKKNRPLELNRFISIAGTGTITGCREAETTGLGAVYCHTSQSPEVAISFIEVFSSTILRFKCLLIHGAGPHLRIAVPCQGIEKSRPPELESISLQCFILDSFEPRWKQTDALPVHHRHQGVR